VGGSSLVRRELCLARLELPDAESVLRELSGLLARLGLVAPTFCDALLAREASSPTGLPLPGRKVAVPHADPEHVRAPAIAVCTLARPVRFAEMGNPTSLLAVEAVFLLALTDKESAQEELVRLLERLQRPEFVDELCAAPDADVLLALLQER
jgi:PTS system galactitol-specific IIA component